MLIVTGTARLVRDPETKATNNGKVMAKGSLAFNPSYSKDKGMFIDYVSFGGTGERIIKYLKKGSQITITGELTFSQWEDKNGNKKTNHSISIDKVKFLSSPRKKSNGYNDHEDTMIKREVGATEANTPENHKVTEHIDDSDIPF